MVQSLIDKSIEYPEIKMLNTDDYNYKAPVYDALILGVKVIIAIGQSNTLFLEKNILYYPIYLIKNNRVDFQIGLYEISADKVANIRDKDDDLDIGDLEPLLYKYTTVETLKKPAKEILKDLIKEKSWIIPGVKALYKGEEVTVKEVHTDDEIPYYTISFQSGTEKQTIMQNLDRVETSETSKKILEEEEDEEKEGDEEDEEDEERQEGDKEKEEEEEVEEDSREDKEEEEIIEQTEEEANKEMSEYKENKDDLWINKYMKSRHYTIKDTGGGGDCLFTSIIEGLKDIGEEKTVNELREMIASNMTEDNFTHAKELYDMARAELVESKKEYTKLGTQFKELKVDIGKLGQESKEEKIKLLKKQKEIAKRLKEVKSEREGTENLFKEFKFMKGINTLEAFRAIIKTTDYWPDSRGIYLLERELKIKLIILSQEYYRTGDVGNVVQCGDMVNDEILDEDGHYRPDHYIIVNYVGDLHYQIIKYKNKGIFKYKELPYELKKRIVEKCLERSEGIYNKIEEFKKLEEEMGKSIQKGGSKLECIIDNLLYDKNGAVLQIYSKSNPNPYPGRGCGEDIGNDRLIDYIRLASVHDDWRKKLSNYWQQKFNEDGKMWNTVEHYYQAAKFKDKYPSFYNEFSLDSNSELSNIPEMAKAAGSVSGMFNGRCIRPKNIKIDNNFFQGKNKEALLKGLRAKFRDNNDLKELLLDTKNAKLQHYVHKMSPVELLDLMRVRKELTS